MLENLRNLVQRVSEARKKDWPFYKRMASDRFARVVSPKLPFKEEEWMTEGEYEKAISKPVPLRERTRFYPPRTKTASAKILPYQLPPPMSPVEKELQQAVLGAYKFRPAAQKYFSGIPLKIGEKYLDADWHLGVQHGQPVRGRANLPWFIGLNPKAATPSGVPLHELLHAAPRTLQIPKAASPSAAAVEGIAGQWKTTRPGTIYEEAFAERALPWEAYEHIFQSPRGYYLNRPRY